MENYLSNIVWHDINPLSTLHDVATAMKPELSIEIDIQEIDGGTAHQMNFDKLSGI